MYVKKYYSLFFLVLEINIHVNYQTIYYMISKAYLLWFFRTFAKK